MSCTDTYERVGDEAKKELFPRGITENFEVIYSETVAPLENEDIKSTKIIAILKSPIRKDYDNLNFPHQIFSEGLRLDLFDDKGNRNVIIADYGIKYSSTNLIDLQGNVVVKSHDGKVLETQQLFFDQENEWVFTQNKFKFTNPEDQTVIYGEGMDIKKDLTFLNAHKTDGVMMIKEENDD